MKKFLAFFLVLAMVLSLAACGEKPAQTTEAPKTTEAAPETTKATEPAASTEAPTAASTEAPTEAPTEPEPEEVEFPEPAADAEFEVKKLASLEYDKDYKSLYEAVGQNITIGDVLENPENGLAYIKMEDGSLHELGLDFLTMAMVYNIETTDEYPTEDDVYAAWWRLYITRWNYLLPEIPLYSNQYYDVYNAQIKGVQEFPTNPYWGPATALIEWTSEKADNDIILGNSTELSGQFRYPAFGKSSPGAADNDIGGLTIGLETVVSNKEGNLEWNNTVVKEHKEEINADGSETFTITLCDDLKFSDGSAVTAKDYIAFTLAYQSPVGSQASKRRANLDTLVGGPDYVAYTGPGSEKGTKELSGIRLLDELTFSVTASADYIPYYYDISYASFSAQPAALWLGDDVEIKDDGNGVYLSDNFYEKDGDDYKHAAQITFAGRDNTDANWKAYPFSGPYAVESYDATAATATLVKNEYFKGNFEGKTPSIQKVVYKKIVSATQLEEFKNGGLDVLSQITGGNDTDNALKAVEESNGKFVYTTYSRAGYGKLGFRADYGPVQFKEVRQAIALCMDRAEFAKTFTGGYGGVVDGPYYKDSWMYKAASAQGMELDAWPTSADSAIEVLEAGGWVFDKDGNEYKEGVRYKKIPGDLASENDINYKSMDGEYTTTKVGDDYYMPLVINWFGTTPNEFTDQLQTGFKENANIATAGFKVYNQLGDFAPMLDELYQADVYGYYAGTPMYCAFNFATGFNSAIYDYSWNMTIDPSIYEDYSSYYIKDYADIFWIK